MLDVERFMEVCGNDCGSVFHGWEDRNTERWDFRNLTIIHHLRPIDRFTFYQWGDWSLSGKYWDQKKITIAEARKLLTAALPIEQIFRM